MGENRFYKEVLDNGIRVVTEEMPSVKSVSIGIWVDVGSRDESDAEAGVSHFVEHMMFKGTARRTAKDIAQEVDGLGGELNAFTSRETTTYYAKVTDEQAPRAIRLLTDLFRRSVFPPAEIEREKQVILEEIKMVEDDPEDLVHELHTGSVWRGNPLSRPVLGRTQTVRAFTRARTLRYIEQQYLPERIVISVAGRFKRRPLLREIRRAFGRLDRRPDPAVRPVRRIAPVMNGKRILVRYKKLEQAHLCLGLPGLPIAHRDRYAASALNILLGGGMSSRLFQEVREKRGLVYTIYSQLAGFQDVGMLLVYAASGPKAIPRVLRLTVRELKRLRETGVNRDELGRAIEQMKGGLLLGLESTNNRMSRLARDEIYLGRFFTPEEVLREVSKISKRQIRQLGDRLLDPDQISLTLLGPVSLKSSEVENALRP